MRAVGPRRPVLSDVLRTDNNRPGAQHSHPRPPQSRTPAFRNISFTHTGTVSIWVQVTPTPPYEWCALWVWVMAPLDREGTRLLSQRIVPRVGDWNASVSLYVQLRGQAPGAATPGN